MRASEVGRVIPNAPLGLRPIKDALPQRKPLPHGVPDWVPTGQTYFITICASPRGTNQLARPEVFAVLIDALEYYVSAKKLWPRLFLAMPDHLHALVSFPDAVRMTKTIRDWKRFVAKQRGVIWQDGFFDHRLRRDESLDEKASYIRQNPVRANLVSAASDWPFVWEVDCATPAR